MALLQETTDEMARNGCKKILIVNGHGGNDSLLPYFAQTQLDKQHDYVVYVFSERTPDHGGPPKKTKIDMHAGESETSKMMISHPELVHPDRATSESGADQARKTFTPVSGGTRVFRSTIPGRAQPRAKNSASTK
jgi:creatinine amidohydrolase